MSTPSSSLRPIAVTFWVFEGEATTTTQRRGFATSGENAPRKVGTGIRNLSFFPLSRSTLARTSALTTTPKTTQSLEQRIADERPERRTRPAPTIIARERERLIRARHAGRTSDSRHGNRHVTTAAVRTRVCSGRSHLVCRLGSGCISDDAESEQQRGSSGRGSSSRGSPGSRAGTSQLSKVSFVGIRPGWRMAHGVFPCPGCQCGHTSPSLPRSFLVILVSAESHADDCPFGVLALNKMCKKESAAG